MGNRALNRRRESERQTLQSVVGCRVSRGTGYRKATGLMSQRSQQFWLTRLDRAFPLVFVIDQAVGSMASSVARKVVYHRSISAFGESMCTVTLIIDEARRRSRSRCQHHAIAHQHDTPSPESSPRSIAAVNRLCVVEAIKGEEEARRATEKRPMSSLNAIDATRARTWNQAFKGSGDYEIDTSQALLQLWRWLGLPIPRILRKANGDL